MEMAQELTTNPVGEGTSHTWYQGDWWALQICPAETELTMTPEQEGM